MEPIYGIILALVIFGENELMNLNFYLGLALIMVAIISNSIYKSRGINSGMWILAYNLKTQISMMISFMKILK